jgi:DUF1365 family protein
MTGKPLPFSDKTLLASLCRSPLQGLKAMALIHFQALRLYLKGIRRVTSFAARAEGARSSG